MNESIGNERCDGEAGNSASEAEETALDEQLRDDAGAAGAKGVAHGHLAGAGGGAQEQESGDVDGAHGYEKAGHAHEENEGSFEVSAARREAAGVVLDLEMGFVEEAFRETLGAIFVEREFLGAEGVP
jgi:hypothetical protein